MDPRKPYAPLAADEDDDEATTAMVAVPRLLSHRVSSGWVKTAWAESEEWTALYAAADGGSSADELAGECHMAMVGQLRDVHQA